MQIGKNLRILGSGPTFIGRVLYFVCPKSPKIVFSAQGGILSEKKLSFPPNITLPLCKNHGGTSRFNPGCLLSGLAEYCGSWNNKKNPG